MNILLLLVIAVTVGAVVFGVMTLITGGDPGLKPAEPDTRARPLPSDRPLVEADISRVTFDTAWRGYRMDQIDQTLRRLAYDIGYKSELIEVLEAEITALREGRLEDADNLASTRAAALAPKAVLSEPAAMIELVSEVAPEVAEEEPHESRHEADHRPDNKPDNNPDNKLDNNPDSKPGSGSDDEADHGSDPGSGHGGDGVTAVGQKKSAEESESVS